MEFSYEINDAIKKLKPIHEEMGVPSTVFLVEECSEVTKEIMKSKRGANNKYDIVSEASDVMLTALMVLRDLGVSDDYVESLMLRKCKKAIEEYEYYKSLHIGPTKDEEGYYD